MSWVWSVREWVGLRYKLADSLVSLSGHTFCPRLAERVEIVKILVSRMVAEMNVAAAVDFEFDS